MDIESRTAWYDMVTLTRKTEKAHLKKWILQPHQQSVKIYLVEHEKVFDDAQMLQSIQLYVKLVTLLRCASIHSRADIGTHPLFSVKFILINFCYILSEFDRILTNILCRI